MSFPFDSRENLLLLGGVNLKWAMVLDGLLYHRPPDKAAGELRDQLAEAIGIKLASRKRISDCLIRATAQAYRGEWPLPDPARPGSFRNRDARGLDVPTLWGVQHHANRFRDDWDHLVVRSERAPAQRAATAAARAYDLANTLRGAIGAPYEPDFLQGWIRPRGNVEAAWTAFEQALGNYRPLIYLPVVAVPLPLLDPAPSIPEQAARGPHLVHDAGVSA